MRTAQAAGPRETPEPTDRPRTRVFVAGAGLMGSGIAAQCALAGYAVTLEDVTPELAEAGQRSLARALDGQLRRGKLSPSDRQAALGRVELTVGLSSASKAAIVVEAAPEKLEVKRAVFRELEARTGPETMLASNTSSLPITSIASSLKDPGRVVGIHFFNPVLQMALVEIVPGHETRAAVVAQADEFARSLGKTVVHSRDTPGFVTTRALAVLLNEAAWMLHDGTATRDDIDAAYKLGFHHPMGPFELADLVGLDTALSILDVLWEGFHDAKYRACPLLRTLVESGKLGRKSGQGFYSYGKGAASPTGDPST